MVAGSSGSAGAPAPASLPADGIPSFASFLSPHETAAANARAAGSPPQGTPPAAPVPPPSAAAATGPMPASDQPAAVADKVPPTGGKAADDRANGKPAKKSQEHTLPSALYLALLGAAMLPPAPEPVATVPLGGAGETPAGNGSAEIPPAGAHPGAGGAPLAGAAPLPGVPQPGPVPLGTAADAAPGAPAGYESIRPLAATSSSGLPGSGATPGAAAIPAAANAAQRATADVLAKLGIAPPPAGPVPPKPPKSPVSGKSLPALDRPASVAGLAAESPRPNAARKNDKVSEVLIRPTGPFTTPPDSAGTGSAQTPAMFHDAHAWRSDAVATSVFHATGVADAAANPTPGSAAPADVHAAAGRAVEAVSVAVEQATRDRNSVKLDFEIGGERVAVVVERHADEIRATFKADSPELRAALSQQWQATAADRATSTVQPVFTDHASSHQLPDSQSRGFARHDNPSGQSGGEQPARGDVPRRRAAVVSPATLAAPSLPSRLPAFRHGSSLHLSTLA